MGVKTYLENQLKQVFKNLGYNESYATLSFSDREGVDFQCNAAFVLAKEEKQKPMDIANNIVNNLTNLKEKCEISTAMPAFINFALKDSYLSEIANELLFDERVGVKKLENAKKIVFDYGGANVAKPLHVGHLRSAIIGESLKRLNVLLGNTTISDVHLGDWGLQMGLTIAQLMDDYNLGFYFGENVPKFEITAEILDIVYPKASVRKKTDEEFYNRASDITLWLQQKKFGYYDVWQEIRKVSIDMVKGSYLELGTTFDLWNGESSVNDIVPEVIEIFKDKNLLYKSDGALIVDVADDNTNEPMPPTIIQKSNGAQMYAITDIATIYQRERDYQPDKIIYITDNRQTLHFKQVIKCVRLANIVRDEVEIEHVTFGTVNGKDGKPFKTRDGGTFKLDDLINLATSKAMDKLKESNKVDTPSKELAKKIGIAALIYGDLANIISKDYIFDLDKFLTFEGKTGPYLQYIGVRIKSILNKAELTHSKIIVDNAQIAKIIMAIIKLNHAYEIAYKENSLHSVCLSLFDLASAFSSFYNDVRILTERDESKKQSYLSLCNLVLNALTLGCGILAIDIPEKM